MLLLLVLPMAAPIWIRLSFHWRSILHLINDINDINDDDDDDDDGDDGDDNDDDDDIRFF